MLGALSCPHHIANATTTTRDRENTSRRRRFFSFDLFYDLTGRCLPPLPAGCPSARARVCVCVLLVVLGVCIFFVFMDLYLSKYTYMQHGKDCCCAEWSCWKRVRSRMSIKSSVQGHGLRTVRSRGWFLRGQCVCACAWCVCVCPFR